MRRPRWHDVILVLGMLALLGVGVWALWGDDVKSWFAPSKPAPEGATPAGTGVT